MPQLMVVKKLNKRSQIPANLPDDNHIVDTVPKGKVFFGTQVTASQGFRLPDPPLDKWYQDAQGFFYWGGALMVIEESPVTPPASVTVPPSTAPLLLAPAVMPVDMPLNFKLTVKCTNFMKANFEDKVMTAVEGTPFDKELAYAIACQETAQRWNLWIDKVSPDLLLQRCVFDASGDVAGTSRTAFPKNRAAMVAKHGEQVTQALVNEANLMRRLPQPGSPNGFGPANLLYKGYGIFQYDLQHFDNDAAFFTEKKWGSIDECLKRLLQELNRKFEEQHHNMLATVRSYNGSGPRAEQYAKNVSQFYTWIRTIPTPALNPF